MNKLQPTKIRKIKVDQKKTKQEKMILSKKQEHRGWCNFQGGKDVISLLYDPKYFVILEFLLYLFFGEELKAKAPLAELCMWGEVIP